MTLVNSILDILFPPRETEIIVRTLQFDQLARISTVRQHEHTTYLLPYQHPLVRACITEAKFFNNRKAQTLLGSLLSHHLATTYTANYICIPIPASAARLRTRGYNQVIEMLRAGNIPYIELLHRTTDVPSQRRLSRNDRQTNVVGSFGRSSRAISSSTTLVLIDDVITTGATMREAARVFAQHQSVQKIALAH